LILLEEKRGVRFAKMTTAGRMGVAGHAAPRRRCCGNRKPVRPAISGAKRAGLLSW
jgi:hypothetical protein